MKIRKVIVGAAFVASFGLLSSAALAQGGGGRGFGPGGGMMNPMILLGNEQIQKELEIVDDQAEQLKAIGDEVREEMRTMFQDMRDMEPEGRGEAMRERMKKFEDRVNEVLLPHQQKRLKQIGNQMRSRGPQGVGGSLTDGDLAEELKITEEQKEKLREVSEQARAEMEEKVAKLRQEMEDKILGVLDAEQREKYKELVGDPFEMDMRQMFQRQGGGNRQRGGDRGQSDF